NVFTHSAVRIALMVLAAGLAVFLLLRGTGLGTSLGTASGRGFSEAIPLGGASAEGGRMAELLVVVGQTVAAGDVIARLDATPLELERRRVLAERAVLAAKLLATRSKEEDAVTRAEVWRLRTVAGAQQDQAALAALDAEVGRLTSLLDDQLVKASDVEPQLRQRNALAARVETYGRARDVGRAGLGSSLAPGNARNHTAAVHTRVAPLHHALEVNAAALAQVDFRLGTLLLKAPANGQVGAILRRPGEMLAPGEAAVTVVAHRPGVFEVYVPSREQRSIHVGKTVLVSRVGL